MLFDPKYSKGLTLIEVMVVAATIAFMTGIMIRNFSVRRLYITEAANIVVADIRSMQQRAIAGATYPDSLGNPVNRCGYGIEQGSTSTTYRTYVAPPPQQGANGNCVNLNKNFTSNGNPTYVVDTVIETKTIAYPGLEFKPNNFVDIFFEPPDPRTYLNNNSALNGNPAAITIGPIGVPIGSCTNSTCKTICVHPGGAINIVGGTSCL